MGNKLTSIIFLTGALFNRTFWDLRFSTFAHELCKILAGQNKTVGHGVVIHKKSKGVKEKVVLDTHYAVDMAILDFEGWQESTDLLAHYSSYTGLTINAKNTKSTIRYQQMCLTKYRYQRLLY